MLLQSLSSPGNLSGLMAAIALMALNYKNLENSVKALDFSLRTKLAEFLTKYDEAKKRIQELETQISQGSNTDSQTQEFLDTTAKAIDSLTQGLDNFSGSL